MWGTMLAELHSHQNVTCLLQEIISCLLKAMPFCLVPVDSPALLKALAVIIGPPVEKCASFMTEEGFAVPIYQVSLMAFIISSIACLASFLPCGWETIVWTRALQNAWL